MGEPALDLQGSPALTDAQRIRNFALCYNNPLLFVEGVLGANPLPWQREALELAAVKSHIAIRSGHTTGKTTFLSWVALWFIMCRKPCKVILAANSADQLRDVDHAEIIRWSRHIPDSVRTMYEWGQERIYFKAGSDEAFITFRTANKGTPEALAGFHSENLLFIIDEASGIENIVFEVASGALSSRGSRAILIGNPTRSTGYFQQAFKENRWRWHCLHWPWKPTPYNDPNYPEQMAREYGATSNVYRIRVLGDFPTSEDNSVIPLDLIEAAVNREVDRTYGRSMVWGLDIARFGDDRCALLKRQGNHVVEPAKAWRHVDLMQTCGIVAREYGETPEGEKPVAINADVIGVGAGVVDRLREIGLPIFGINVGETSTDADRFMRQRDELWWQAREWFQRRDCKIPNDPALISDLVGPTYKLLSSGKLQVETKDDMKKRGLKSPDVADAFCLTFAGGEFAQDYRRHSHSVDEGGVNLDGLAQPAYSYGRQQTHAET